MRRFERHRVAAALTVVAALGAGFTATEAAPAIAATHAPAKSAPSAPSTRAAPPAPAPSPASAKPTPTPTPTPTPSRTPAPTPAPRPVGRALAVEILGGALLTLPAADHLRDSTRIRIRSAASGRVDLLAIAGTRTVHLADALQLKRATAGWSRTETVSVRELGAGTWTVRARRSADHAVRARAAAPLTVGSGEPVHVLVHPAHRTAYPYPDGVLDAIDTTVTVTDETGTALPFTGRLKLDTTSRDRTATLSRTGAARIAVTGLPLGAAHLVATVTAPAGATTRTTAVTLAPTGAGQAHVALSSDTVQPVVDGLLDAVTFTTSGAAVAGSPAAVAGTLIVAGDTAVARRWAVKDGTVRAFTWDGRIGGVIVPGTYTATLWLKGPEGQASTTTKTVLVTKDHLPYRMQDLFTVAAGNQQGLAVHDGTFYVGFDNGDGTARIEKYDSAGAPRGTLGPLAIGHAAELG